MKTLQTDYENTDRLRSFFNYSKDIHESEKPLNLIIEVRIADNNQEPISKYWTVFGVFDPAGNLNVGRWRLPLYATPTNLNIQMM
jgi:hypothetical protein